MKSAYAKRSKVLPALFAAVALQVLVLLPIFAVSYTPKASAADASVITSARFLDADQIRIEFNNEFFTLLKDGDPNDSRLVYEASGNEHDCHGIINLAASNAYNSSFGNVLEFYDANSGSSIRVGADIDFPSRPDANSGFECEGIPAINSTSQRNLAVTDFANVRHYFRYVDSGTIERADGDGNWIFERDSENPRLYFRAADSDAEECKDYIEIIGNGSSYRLFDISMGGGGDDVPDTAPVGKNCKYNDNGGDDFHLYGYLDNDGKSPYDPMPIGNSDRGPENPSVISAGEEGDIGGGGTSGPNQPSCESEGGELSWILCPLLRIADSFVSFLDNQIESLLTVPDAYFQNEQLQETWARIRNIAYIILVPVMLIMVISTALGFEFISAYTVKRALPRLIAAVLFMALSFELTTFLIVLTNNVGSGILGLMTSAFGGSSDLTLAGLFDPSLVNAGLFTGLLVGGAVGVVAVTSVGIVLSYALIVGVALLIGFLVLALRQFLLLALVVLAPLAILAWIFPGNDKLWKLWWGTFSKLLLLFPLIMILIAAGRIFASVADTAPGSGILETILILTAYVAPYFFIPATFKFAGGLFATLAGMANDRSRGLFDRQRKYRTETRAALKDRSSKNIRFNPNRGGVFGALGRRMNTATGWAADPYNNARIKMGSMGGKALLSDLTQRSVQQSQKLAEWMGNAGMNQEALNEVAQNYKKHGHFDYGALQERIATLKKSEKTQERAAAGQLERIAPYLQSISTSEDYNKANIGAAAGFARASQGFLTARDTVDMSNFLNTQMPGLGDTFKTQADLLSARAGGFGKPGYSEQVDMAGRYVAGGTAARAIQFSRMSVQDIASGKASVMQSDFIDNGAIEQILTADTSQGEASIIDPITKEKASITAGKQQAALDNLVQAAYGYNTPAETAAVLRQQLSDLEGRSPGLAESIQKARTRVTRDYDPSDPSRRPPPPPEE